MVLNPASARTDGNTLHTAVRAALLRQRLRFRIVRIEPGAAGSRSLATTVRRALRDGCDRVIAAGGDGTIGLVASCMCARSRSRTALAIIPTGTANVLARELGIPTTVPEAIALAVESQTTLELDAMKVGERLILTQLGIGADALMISDTRRAQQERYGRLAYLLAFIRQAASFRSIHFRLSIDGAALKARAWQLIVANAGSAGAPPFSYGPGVDPADGEVDLCLFDLRGWLGGATVFWRILTGRHRRDNNTSYYPVRDSLTIDTRRSVAVQGDGELIGTTPITLTVVPRAIRVVVPKSGATLEDHPDVAGTADIPREVSSATAESAPLAANGVVPTTPAAATLAEDLSAMVAQHSKTWVLHGMARHPIAALSALDAAIYIRLNRLAFGPPWDSLLIWTSRLMHYGEGWAVAALILVVRSPAQGVRAAAEMLPVLWLTMLTMNYPLKRLFRRRRPFVAFVEVRVLGPRPRDFSFPSGHSAAAFAGALLMSAHAPGWSPWLFAVATVVGFSRVYLGVHYPSDVLIGAAGGMGLAVLFRLLLHRLVEFAF
ncbi:MAG: phosphatase PAP2 family protein [Candidatus Eisenbacteria bacterium]|uniref:Phosphatase PAP2 family protein n=1 Tax=Eiseniibacteriota bacterium TaxID=2212470 RepID=A0A849SMS6_UNCEI|nr:phosphatase PAP2 family protein [Candidatus Eisenbacteria bacterium]